MLTRFNVDTLPILFLCGDPKAEKHFGNILRKDFVTSTSVFSLTFWISAGTLNIGWKFSLKTCYIVSDKCLLPDFVKFEWGENPLSESVLLTNDNHFCPNIPDGLDTIELEGVCNQQLKWSKKKILSTWNSQRRGQHLPGLRDLEPIQCTPVCAVDSQRSTGGAKTQTPPHSDLSTKLNIKYSSIYWDACFKN